MRCSLGSLALVEGELHSVTIYHDQAPPAPPLDEMWGGIGRASISRCRRSASRYARSAASLVGPSTAQPRDLASQPDLIFSRDGVVMGRALHRFDLHPGTQPRNSVRIGVVYRLCCSYNV